MSSVSNERQIHYDYFFQTSSDLLCVLDERGHLIAVNQSFRDVLGYPGDVLIGEPLATLLHPEDVEPLRTFFSPEGATRPLLRLDGRFLQRDMSYRKLIFGLRRVEGDPHVYGAGHEDGPQRSVEEGRRQQVMLQKMQAVARVGGWEVDCRTWDHIWTEETFRIHDLPPGVEPSVEGGINFYAPEDIPIINAAFKACATEGKPYDMELQIVTAKGRRVWVRTAGSPIIEDGEVVRVIGAFQDIDDMKRRELDLAEKLSIIAEQRSAIHAMSAPVINVWDGVLALPIVGTVDRARAAEITSRVLDAVVEGRARYAILDLTGVEILDEATADHLVRILRAIQLLGAKGLVTGIRPAVAQTLTALHAGFSDVRTLSNLREAIKLCMREQRPRSASALGRGVAER
ncbi:STAS domain-containing protein [Chondromyces apiculatus]|uniref:RsbR, positive regulator of sigma-B n=1 Tax=Chondromyces apiculatus DSM 436 TaxID=1192034 RepID=A0A017TD99_9BACT|nr:STAS domain-containing protein [Chondromyces apiculatus]EYF06902.1 RsbR, positive regulator of sigma-B [Chondromyces apiculatus DSM 436]